MDDHELKHLLEQAPLADPTEEEWHHLLRCVELAEEALAADDEPFGSVLVSADGRRLAEGRNRVVETGDRTQHPEIALARWAAEHLRQHQREGATVFTSGEHCPMCAAAHGWVGLGRIVYVHSSEQLAEWLDELGVAPARVRTLPIGDVVRDVHVQGPVPDLVTRMRGLHERFHQRRPT